MAHRYFTTDITGGQARITGPDAAHLARVLRAEPGETLTLCDGAGFDYSAKILSATPAEITLEIVQKIPSAAEPTLRAEVFIGMARGERMDLAIQKSVELGAAAIHPFYSANCVVKPKNDGEKTTRYARIAAEAAKQCGRGILPTVHPPVHFADILPPATRLALPLFLYEAGGQPLRAAYTGQKSAALITGPEGGFTPEEAQAAAAAGCVTIGLGPRILRSETAPAAALAALMTLSGNLESP